MADEDCDRALSEWKQLQHLIINARNLKSGLSNEWNFSKNLVTLDIKINSGFGVELLKELLVEQKNLRELAIKVVFAGGISDEKKISLVEDITTSVKGILPQLERLEYHRPFGIDRGLEELFLEEIELDYRMKVLTFDVNSLPNFNLFSKLLELEEVYIHCKMAYLTKIQDFLSNFGDGLSKRVRIYVVHEARGNYLSFQKAAFSERVKKEGWNLELVTERKWLVCFT